MLKKLIALIIVLLVTVFAITYLYVYQDHRDISNTNTFKSYTASELVALFTDADSTNEKEVLDQVIEVTGTVTAQSQDGIVINENIFVMMIQQETFKDLELITIKGRCLGYDDLLEELKIDQATIITD